MNKGIILSYMRQTNLAIPAFDKAIEINPDHYWVWIGRAGAFSEEGDINEALKSINKSISMKPDRYVAWHLKGIILENYGEFEKAVAVFDQVLRINSKFVEALCIKGSIFKKLKKYVEATSLFEEVLKNKPKNYFEWYIKGRAHFELGSYEDAIYAYNKTLQLDPNETASKYNKALLLATCPEENYRDGHRALELWKEIEYIYKSYYDILAAIYAENGNFEKAVAIQEDHISYLIQRGKEKAVERGDLKQRLVLYKSKKPYRHVPVNAH